MWRPFAPSFHSHHPFQTRQSLEWIHCLVWHTWNPERERERGGCISEHTSEHLEAQPAALHLLHAEQIQSGCARWNPRQIPYMHQRPQTKSQLIATWCLNWLGQNTLTDWLRVNISHFNPGRISSFDPGSCFPNWLQGKPRMVKLEDPNSSCSAFRSDGKKVYWDFFGWGVKLLFFGFDLIKQGPFLPTYCLVYPQYVATLTKRTLMPLKSLKFTVRLPVRSCARYS